jgi:hypothetical protein
MTPLNAGEVVPARRGDGRRNERSRSDGHDENKLAEGLFDRCRGSIVVSPISVTWSPEAT